MAAPPTCPGVHCADKGNPMAPGALRRHDQKRKITRYKCVTCGFEMTKRAA